MEKIITKDFLKSDIPALAPVLSKLRRDFSKVSSANFRAKALRALAPSKRRAFEQVFALLYECPTDKNGARLLVDRMLARLAKERKRKKHKG